MSTPVLEIQLKQGLNGLQFRAGNEEAKAILGEPNEIEALEQETDDDPETELWYYDDLGLCLFFEADPDFELTSIEINNENALLFGAKIFDMNEDQVIDLMKANGFSEMYTEDEEWGEKLLSFDDALIDFYFEEGKLVSANWSLDIPDEE